MLCLMFWIQVVSKTVNHLFCTGGICDPGVSHENDIILYAKIEGRKEHIALDTLTYSSYKVQTPILMPDDVPRNSKAKARSTKTMPGTEDAPLFLPPQEVARFFF